MSRSIAQLLNSDLPAHSSQTCSAFFVFNSMFISEPFSDPLRVAFRATSNIKFLFTSCNFTPARCPQMLRASTFLETVWSSLKSSLARGLSNFGATNWKRIMGAESNWRGQNLVGMIMKHRLAFCNCSDTVQESHAISRGSSQNSRSRRQELACELQMGGRSAWAHGNDVHAPDHCRPSAVETIPVSCRGDYWFPALKFEI